MLSLHIKTSQKNWYLIATSTEDILLLQQQQRQWKCSFPVLSSLKFVFKVSVIPVAAILIKYEECLGTETDSENPSNKVYKYAQKFADP